MEKKRGGERGIGRTDRVPGLSATLRRKLVERSTSLGVDEMGCQRTDNVEVDSEDEDENEDPEVRRARSTRTAGWDREARQWLNMDVRQLDEQVLGK